MNPTTIHRRTHNERVPVFLARALAALAAGVALFLLFVLLFTAALNGSYSSKIYPGISVSGVNLSGLSEQEAARKLAAELQFPQNGKIVLQAVSPTIEGLKIWVAKPAELGLALDPQANALAAYQLGRSGRLPERLAERFGAWYGGRDLPATLVYEEQAALAYLRQIATEIDRPVIEASLSVDGLQVSAMPGQIGRQVDVQASLQALQAQMRNLTDGVVALVIVETRPAILDASVQADEARKYLSGPLTLSLPDAQPGDPGPWQIAPEQLAAMLAIERVPAEAGEQYRVGLSQEALKAYLENLGGQVNRSPANARMMFNDDTRKLEVIQPAVTGRTLDVAASAQSISEKLLEGEHNVPLTLTYQQPEVGNDATGEQLGISEQIVAYTSYFRGSSQERLQNIQKAAANFHGLLIPPGATFSMASVMGDVSLDSGYAEAWIIFGGRTIKGVGGGVCQVSTTLFRTAFLAGFPIGERHPHAYRVGYYEQTAGGYDPDMAGLDATVFIPLVDFKFTNDTPYWLLMETYFHPNSRSLTWKFYSTSDGRQVEWQTTGPQNVVEAPDPQYEENPELGKGEIIQVDWAAEGADVTVTRTVYRNGQVWLADSFATHYMPWADVYQYGPGTKLPKKPKMNP